MNEKLQEDIEGLNSLVYWFPILQRINMRVPETRIIHRGDVELGKMIDGEKVKGLKGLVEKIDIAVQEVGGYPVFFRTGMTSNKHDWKNSCFLKQKKDIISHIYNLVEHSFIANIAGMPFQYDFWIIRKMIPTRAITTAFAGKMPVAKELRVFIKNGKVQCYHPYWVKEAIKNKEDLKQLQKFSKTELEEPLAMANYIAQFFSGYWSVDFLKDDNGNYWCIDMAVGPRSYHFENCKFAKENYKCKVS